MRKHARFLFYLWLVGGLAACVLPAPLNPVLPEQDAAKGYETVSVLLTGTAESIGEPTISLLFPTSTQTPVFVSTTIAPETNRTPLASATTQAAAGSSDSDVESRPCDLAQPGRPIDITVPDESQFRSGEYFAKTWRLVNAGTCAWTEEYAVVWFSGDDLGINHEQMLGAVVQPGKSVDVTVDMIAPQDAGVYQSNWKMRGAAGDFFGIGPNGDAPFWARIVVIPADTPTPEPTEPPPATETAAPLVLLQDSVNLAVEEGVELDPGSSLEPLEDLFLWQSEDGLMLLEPSNGARVALMADVQPSYALCRFATLSDKGISLDGLEPGVLLCYSTSTGLPGRAQLAAFDSQAGEVSLIFLTWAVQ